MRADYTPSTEFNIMKTQSKIMDGLRSRKFLDFSDSMNEMFLRADEELPDIQLKEVMGANNYLFSPAP
jgi:hypothetical protein